MPGSEHPVLAWKLDVHQYNVGQKRPGLGEGAFGILSLANDGEVILVGEEGDEPLAKERMVVNQEESQGLHACPLVSFVEWGWRR